MRMVSRAYHDALFMAQIAPTGMIFVPCKGGVSHRPDEFSSKRDMENGVRTLALAMAKLAGPWPGPAPVSLVAKKQPRKKSLDSVFLLFFDCKKDVGHTYESFPPSFALRSLPCVRKTKDSVFMAEAHLWKSFRGLRPCIISSADTK